MIEELDKLYNHLTEKNNDLAIICLEKILRLQANDIKGAEHPLGFYVFHLGMLDEHTSIRLHIWKTSKVQSNDLMIHNHIFDIDSCVLIGEIVNNTYNIIADKNSNGVLYSVEYSNDGSNLLVDTIGVKAILNDSITISEGQWYHLDYNVFHESIVTKPIYTATLLITTKKTKQPPQVYGYINMGEIVEHDRRKLSQIECSELIEELLGKLVF